MCHKSILTKSKGGRGFDGGMYPDLCNVANIVFFFFPLGFFFFLFKNKRSRSEIMLRLYNKERSEERFCYLRDCWYVCVPVCTYVHLFMCVLVMRFVL